MSHLDPRAPTVGDRLVSEKTAKHWIDKLSMIRHFEGGWYKEMYKSSEIYNHLHERYGKNATRSVGTHIYFLLEHGDFAEFHQLKSDEIWQHYFGSTITLYTINHVTGELKKEYLGPDADNFVGIVSHGDYYAARLEHSGEGSYCLLGNTVSPGFELEDFHRSPRAQLLQLFPQHRKEIVELTRG